MLAEKLIFMVSNCKFFQLYQTTLQLPYSEELDSDDTDWEPKKLDPSLKFKKKSHDDDELPSVLGDTIPPPPSLKPQPRVDKPSVLNSAPPPLRKQTPTSDLSTEEASHIKSKWHNLVTLSGVYFSTF